jgi:glycosyltransferase involved in cell wall biosynthesis
MRSNAINDVTEATADATPSVGGSDLHIHFVHAAPTPHNNYLLDAVASSPRLLLHRHYLLDPVSVPGRPWKAMRSGEVQTERIHAGYDTRWDWRLLKLALFDRRSVFFVVGWDYPILVLLLLVLGLRRRPLMMWDDGPDPESLATFQAKPWQPRQALKRLLVALVNRTPGTYFHTGQTIRPQILALGISAQKLCNLPFFVRPGQRDAELRRAYGCDADTVLIVAGGRLVPEKGYDIFVRALAQLAEQTTRPWQAVLIGSGPERQRLASMALELDLDECLHFLAWAEPEAFADHVHSSDIFVAPARSDHFPTTVIAALQAGVAVVTTDAVGSAVEFMESGQNGIIVLPSDPEALAVAMATLVNDPLGRIRLGAAGARTMQAWPVERGARLIVDAARSALAPRAS